MSRKDKPLETEGRPLFAWLEMAVRADGPKHERTGWMKMGSDWIVAMAARSNKFTNVTNIIHL